MDIGHRERTAVINRVGKTKFVRKATHSQVMEGKYV